MDRKSKHFNWKEAGLLHCKFLYFFFPLHNSNVFFLSEREVSTYVGFHSRTVFVCQKLRLLPMKFKTTDHEFCEVYLKAWVFS